jgi:hypothetical protein
MKFIFKYFYFKLLFTFVFVLVLNSKMSANSTQLYTSSTIEFFSSYNLNVNELEAADADYNDISETEQEEAFSNDFSANYKNSNRLNKKGFIFIQNINIPLFLSIKKRYYILYCQLIIYL